MNRPLQIVAVTVLVLLPSVALAEYYKLQGVKRVDQDLYKTSDRLYLETEYCYRYTYGEDALLKWEYAGSINKKIIWNLHRQVRMA